MPIERTPERSLPPATTEPERGVREEGWALVAALLSGTPGLAGLRYLALGAVDARGRFQELHRVALPTKAWGFLDAGGAPSRAPTPRLALHLSLKWSQATPLRFDAFALVGGAASEAAGSGALFSLSTHAPVTLEPGVVLQRRVVLDLRPSARPPTLEAPTLEPPEASTPRGAAPSHPLLAAASGELAGVGKATARDLEARGLTDIRGLAALQAKDPSDALLRTRARWIQQLLGALEVPAPLRPLSVEQLCTTPAVQLVMSTRVTLDVVLRVQDQLGLLKLLHQGVAWSATLGELVEPEAGESAT